MDQVPAIAIAVPEHDGDRVTLIAPHLDEFDTAFAEEGVVAVEIVGVQKQEHAPTDLVADAFELRWVCRAREQQTIDATDAAGT